MTLQTTSLAFFHVNPTSYQQMAISMLINFVDLSSLQHFLAANMSPVSIGLLAFIILLYVFIVICGLLYPKIMQKQPWIITALRTLTEFSVSVLLVPFLNLAINQFDCHRDQKGTLYFRGTSTQYFGQQIIHTSIGLTASVIFLVMFFALIVVDHLLIYQHNPKYGGFFSTPTFQFQLLQAILLYGTVFAMRMLINWPFWRFLVTVGVSAFLVLWVLVQQPYYHFMGNFLTILRWTIFGCLRAFLELAYLIGGFITTANASTVQLIITIVCAVVGAGCSVGLSILFFRLLSNRTRRKWLLTDDGMPLADPDHPSKADLPKMKNYKLVEPSVRFIQRKEYRSADYINYADLIYTTALKRHKTKAELHFHYANFLTHFRKNHVKAQSVYRTARMSNPSWPLRFQLFCQTKEESSRGGIGSEMANAQFQLQMSKAEEMHETAKNAMRDFFSNLTAPHPKLSVIPTLLHLIVENEAKARKIYEDQLNTHPQSTRLLRQYASLLLDIYDDEDMADIIIQRADQIEEDSTVTLPTATGGTDQQAGIQPIDHKVQQDEKASRASGTSGASGASKQKPSKKKKKRNDALLTELGGLARDDTKTTKTLVCTLIVTLHTVLALLIVVALVVYLTMSKDYSTDINVLREVTRLAEYTGRTPTYALMFFVLNFVYGFDYETPSDGKSPALIRETFVREGLMKGATFITNLVAHIFDFSSFTDPWVSPDVETYLFQLEMQENPYKTGNPDIDDLPLQPMVAMERPETLSLAEALTAVSQKSRELGESHLVPVPNTNKQQVDYPTFQSDVLFLLANCPQPITNALKKAVVSYMNETSNVAEMMIKVYLSILLSLGLLVLVVLTVVYCLSTAKMVRKRKAVLIDLLDVPKAKLQSVIRRLIETDRDEAITATEIQSDSEDTSEADNVELDEGHESQAGEFHNGEKSHQFEENHDESNSMKNTPSSSNDQNSSFTSNVNPLLTPSSNVPPHNTLFSPTTLFSGFPSFSPVPSPSLYPHPASSPIMPFFPNQTTQSSNPALSTVGERMGLKQSDQIGLQPMGNSQTTPMITPTGSIYGQPISQASSLSHVPSLSGTSSHLNNMRPVPLNFPLQFSQMGMTSPVAAKMDAKRKKAEEKKRKDEEEEKMRRVEEKRHREEEARRKKEKFNSDVSTLIANIADLPSPLTKRLVLPAVLNIVISVAALAVLCVLVFILVRRYEGNNKNITLSGMRNSILSLIEFLNIRLLYNYANITPKDPTITFPTSTNPVMKGFEHLSHNKTELYGLLVKSSKYFQQLHSATHFGVSEFSHTDDSYFDDVITSRLSTEDNEKTLLRQQECYLEEAEDANCSIGNRIFDVKFPISGLSTLISQMRLYIWLMSGDDFEYYTELHPIPRFIGSACRYDLRGGMNTLTNEILETSQKSIRVSKGILIGVSVALCAVLYVSMGVFAMRWLYKVTMNAEESTALYKLLPISSEEKEMTFLNSMLTGHRVLDEGRQKIFDAALNVLESLSTNESMTNLCSNLDLLIITTTQVFGDEEAEMDKRDYDQLEEHAHEHLVIRQRLTWLCDEMKLGQTAQTRIAKRYLIRLFDSHFLNDDVLFGNTIPAEEKRDVEGDGERMRGDEEHDADGMSE
ncbi:hypothetical protein BLNAU_17517 [Blattamonas nauphoetae]|uniref:TmcB/TmcC TPR repeats domain-containing protein n=1 Tax=Blattamonas nauphoetae TaxID=2049346 RepID=A0ABQ9X8M5_9EUKA|nr:hypothetical protein BLNAU_17517 [Blattamonas nauphoetae]